MAQRTHDRYLFLERVDDTNVHRAALCQPLYRTLVRAVECALVHRTVGPTTELGPEHDGFCASILVVSIITVKYYAERTKTCGLFLNANSLGATLSRLHSLRLSFDA